MNTVVLEKTTAGTQGLDLIASLVRRGTRITTLDPWIESAFNQLETDDSISCETTDQLADLLEHAQELTAQGLSPVAPLQTLCRIYYPQHCLETVWAQCADDLTEEDLDSETWQEFAWALDALTEQDWETARDWVEEMADLYIGVWNEYEDMSILPSEVTQESVLGHKYLKQGVAHWLQALQLIQDGIDKGRLDLCRIKGEAESGQRLLLTVQIMEQEQQNNEKFYFANWN